MTDVDMRGPMDRTALNAFLSEPVLARIATIRGDWPHVAPMWFDWDGESIWMETGPGFQKRINLEANPHCAIVIDTTEGGLRFKGVIMEGAAELIAEPEDFTRGIAARIYRKYLGEEGIAEPTPSQMIANPHVIIRLRPARIRTWDDT
ncbi:MAG: pyridoxamine 5'-phosphate oxidase family protein [Chloroflexia bacterium]|nr:pyridoxamine 5'-phosphate oxidase family protein [Chloroflexia bacterium]MDQ3411264.1 pyridoxamine 5'-phosphate oxidase family protein [Chloroflexota bacterium]